MKGAAVTTVLVLAALAAGYWLGSLRYPRDDDSAHWVVATETSPLEGDDTFGWLVIDDQVHLLLRRARAALPAGVGQRVKIRGRFLCREVTGWMKLVDCAAVK